MSHNSVKIGNVVPNADGNIALSVSDLSDVSTAGLAVGQTLAFDGVEWSPQPMPSGAASYLYIGSAGTNVPSNSITWAHTAGSQVYAPGTTVLNTISGATIANAPLAEWYGDISLPAGRYSLMTNYDVWFSSTGYFDYVWRRIDTNDTISTIGVKGDSLSLYPTASDGCTGVFALDAPTTIRCNVEAAVGLYSPPTSSFTSVSSYLLIRRVS